MWSLITPGTIITAFVALAAAVCLGLSWTKAIPSWKLVTRWVTGGIVAIASLALILQLIPAKRVAAEEETPPPAIAAQATPAPTPAPAQPPVAIAVNIDGGTTNTAAIQLAVQEALSSATTIAAAQATMVTPPHSSAAISGGASPREKAIRKATVSRKEPSTAGTVAIIVLILVLATAGLIWWSIATKNAGTPAATPSAWSRIVGSPLFPILLTWTSLVLIFLVIYSRWVTHWAYDTGNRPELAGILILLMMWGATVVLAMFGNATGLTDDKKMKVSGVLGAGALVFALGLVYLGWSYSQRPFGLFDDRTGEAKAYIDLAAGKVMFRPGFSEIDGEPLIPVSKVAALPDSEREEAEKILESFKASVRFSDRVGSAVTATGEAVGGAVSSGWQKAKEMLPSPTPPPPAKSEPVAKAATRWVLEDTPNNGREGMTFEIVGGMPETPAVPFTIKYRSGNVAGTMEFTETTSNGWSGKYRDNVEAGKVTIQRDGDGFSGETQRTHHHGKSDNSGRGSTLNFRKV